MTVMVDIYMDKAIEIMLKNILNYEQILKKFMIGKP
jgi:hypothetical protein